MFANQADATRAAQALRREPVTPVLLDRLHGKSTGKLDGEEFYFAARIHLGAALFGAARALPDGCVSSPVAAKDGFHLIVMRRNRRPQPFAFEEIRGQVLTDYRTDKIARMQSDENRFLRKRANIQIAGDLR